MRRNAAFRTLSAAVLLVVFALGIAPGWAVDFQAIYKFNGRDGAQPNAGLIFDAAGNLYGTATVGGSYEGNCVFGCGTVFRLTPRPDGSWEGSTLHKFKFSDGAYPSAALVIDSAGSLYGTTAGGGSGTVFKLTPQPDGRWKRTTVHTFHYWDGSNPYAGLTFDAAGSLYGTTAAGGHGRGAAFKLTLQPDGRWKRSKLHDFNGADGSAPFANLIFDAAGNLYGTTKAGGAHDMGTAFQLMPQPDGSWKRRKLHDFDGADGQNPCAGFAIDQLDHLYGTTVSGGPYGAGTVFMLTLQPDGKWKRSKLHNFKGSDGSEPLAGLIFDGAGGLYGTTSGGGAYGGGTVFKLTHKPDGRWKLTKLHSFKNHSPQAGLVMDGAGNLYGTTYVGGFGYGEVFRITP